MRLTRTSSVEDPRGVVQERQRVGTDVRIRGLKCGDDVGEETRQIGVLVVQRQPGHTKGAVPVRLARREPLRQQGGLPEAGWRRDQDQPRGRVDPPGDR